MGEEPRIKQLTRRQWLGILGGAGVGAIAGAVGVAAYLKKTNPGPDGLPDSSPLQSAEPPPEEPLNSADQVETITLSELPSHNPGFMVLDQPDGGLLTWAQGTDGETKAFELNPPGRAAWLLCNGANDRETIAAAFASTTGRNAQEAYHFLDELISFGVVVEGKYTVATENFFLPPDGGAYHVLLPDNQPAEA